MENINKDNKESVSDENEAQYVPPAFKVIPGKAPGMRVQLLSADHDRKAYAVIFSKGDEVISGLNEFAQTYHVTSAHFTGIGAWRSATLAWFSAAKKMYKKIPIDDQVEVASMIGDIALVKGTPTIHTHAVVGFPDGTAKAGHILEAFVWPTLEVMVIVEPNAMYRQLDIETGLTLIDPGLANRGT